MAVDPIVAPDQAHWSVPHVTRAHMRHSAEVLFLHQGGVDHSVVEQLLARAERWSMEDGVPVGVRKRLFNVLVEALENLHHHALDMHRSGTWAGLLRKDDAYIVLIGNPVPQTTALVLQNRIDILNDMDEETLKQHYLALLSNEGRTERGGAGLGLLTMARKSQRPIGLVTEVVDEGTARVVMELLVPRKG